LNALLQIENLTTGYRVGKTEHLLFENLNLSLKAGELVCFMGSNGAGKSTLIRTIAGLQKPLAGKIIFGSADHVTKTIRPEKISVVLTDRISAVNMTVYELISFGRYPYLDWDVTLREDDKKIIDRSIEQVRIHDLINKKLYELSDGQLQMAMIARALAQDGDIILLDEPTAHLDLNNRVEIMNLLRKLTRTTNKAILLATHELDLALQTADLIWLAGKDKTIITGIPEDFVLNNSFDTIFQLKGFDLKTGKLEHEVYQHTSVKLMGEGYEYRWTKNALERNGYIVNSDAHEIEIQLIKKGDGIHWHVHQSNSQTSVVQSISALLTILRN